MVLMVLEVMENYMIKILMVIGMPEVAAEVAIKEELEEWVVPVAPAAEAANITMVGYLIVNLLEIRDNTALEQICKVQTSLVQVLAVKVAMRDRIQVQVAEVVAMILDLVEMVVLV